MPKTHTVVLTRAARETSVPLDELNDAALAAAENAKGRRSRVPRLPGARASVRVLDARRGRGELLPSPCAANCSYAACSPFWCDAGKQIKFRTGAAGYAWASSCVVVFACLALTADS